MSFQNICNLSSIKTEIANKSLLPPYTDSFLDSTTATAKYSCLCKPAGTAPAGTPCLASPRIWWIRNWSAHINCLSPSWSFFTIQITDFLPLSFCCFTCGDGNEQMGRTKSLHPSPKEARRVSTANRRELLCFLQRYHGSLYSAELCYWQLWWVQKLDLNAFVPPQL